MKRIELALLLTALLLTGCGGEKGPAAGEMSVPESEAAELSADLLLQPEWEEYDPSVETIWFTLENHTGDEIETGVDYALETLGENGSWYQVPFREDVGWTMELLSVADGGTVALSCWLDAVDWDLSDGGTYRIVKTVGDQTCAGEFRLTQGAAISADRPYGFDPLEDWTETADNAVIFDGNGASDLEQVGVFLEKTRLGLPCQLRTVQDYGEGAVMVIDVIYENDHFLWRMRQMDEITEHRFSYIVTDGTALYLSNGADWNTTLAYGSDKAFLVPEGQCQNLISAVEQSMKDRLEWNVIRYRVWDASGVWCAGTSGESSTEFFVAWQKPGEGSAGSAYDLQDWDGLETAITGLEWQEDGRLKLTCQALEGRSVLYFDPETETLSSGGNDLGTMRGS